jgi:hypothetical protein
MSYREQADTAPRGATKVLVAGDALALSLGAHTKESFTGGGIRGTTVSLYGCGLSTADIVVGRPVPAPPQCAELPDTIRNAVESFSPDVSVLMAGPNEVFDRVVEGRLLRIGTPELESYLHAELDRIRRLLRTGATPLVLLTVPCMEPPASASPGVRATQGDERRVAWLNDVWRRYAQRRPETVRLVEYGDFLCRSAAAEPQAMRTNGVVLSAAGAAETWHWLAPIATAIAHEAPN